MTGKQIANYCSICGAKLERREWHGVIRPVCPACGHVVYFDPKVAVVVWIERDEQVLLIQRAYEPGMGKWALPAGFVDAGEPPEEAATREVWEETGLKTHITRLIDVFPKRDNGLADIVIAYKATIIAGELQAGDDAADAQWFGKDNLPPLVFYPSITLVNRWLANEL